MSEHSIFPGFLESGVRSRLEYVSDDPSGEVPAQVHEQELTVRGSTKGRIHNVRIGFRQRVIEAIQSAEIVIECT
jgi:cytoskeletal protein CcmA (bactofilin family)